MAAGTGRAGWAPGRGSATPGRRQAKPLMAVLASVMLVVAAANVPDADADWDAVSEFPGAERQGAILQALSLGLNFTNVSRNDCVWKRVQDSHDICSDGDVSVHLYTSVDASRPVNVSEASSLLQGDWHADKHTILLVHGYGGAHDALPLSILRDAYLRTGAYNVLVLDWARLARLPCYPAAVHNAAAAAHCVGGVARLLRDSGARGDAWTCVGHSLGAHVCGIMADTVMFRVHKIIGLDPARPLIRPQNKHRLDAGDAAVVHVMHTNAGHYGELGAMGTADFCVNGGRDQPFCSAAKNPNLCSHLSSICFLADSLDGEAPLTAEPCGRRCPSARRQQADSNKQRLGLPASLGQHTPDSASGTFCASSAAEPYCQRTPGGRGHPRCCPPRHHVDTSTSTTTSTAAPAAPRAPTTTVATAERSTASTVRTETTTSSFKVGAALPTTTTDRPSDTTTTPPPPQGYSPVTTPVRVARPVVVDQDDKEPAGGTTSPPVRFPTTTPAVQPPATPAVEVPVNMMPPPMPQPDWQPIVFAAKPQKAPAEDRPVDVQVPQPAPRPTEPLLPRTPTKGPGHQVVFPAEQNVASMATVAPARTTTSQVLEPQSWSPPPVAVTSQPVGRPAPPSGLHIVMPSNDGSLYAEEAEEAPGAVFAVYSTRSPLTPDTRPLVVVMANAHPADPVDRRPFGDIGDNLVEPSTPVAQVTLGPGGFDQAEAAMTEMVPPSPEPVLVSGFTPASPPPPEPATPEVAGMVPAAGSPTGAWLPMVMLPPMPFAVDSWALRYKDRLPRPLAVRRTSFRKKVYD